MIARSAGHRRRPASPRRDSTCAQRPAPRAARRGFAVGAALLLSAAPAGVPAASFSDHFAVVFIDSETESRHGAFPLDRALVAKGIAALAAAGARGVVVKFFLDRAGDDAGDEALALAMRRVPVILQARIDNAEPAPNPLPARFTLPFPAATAFSGSSGWIPAPRFAAVAADIGFVDYEGMPVALLETYRDRTVKSLLLATLELAAGAPAAVEPAHRASIGAWSFALDTLNRTAVTPAAWPALASLPFHELLADGGAASGRADQVRGQLEGKVVILGYDGARIPMLQTPMGRISAHRVFIRVLEALFEQGAAAGHAAAPRRAP